jgi:hypothetical protein
MAREIYDDNPAVVVAGFTFKADGAIPFGRLVELGTDVGDVKVTAGITAAVVGMAFENEQISQINGSEAYADGDVVTVKALTPGKNYRLTASGAITRGDFVSAAADGKVSTVVPGSGTSYQVIGVAEKDIDDGALGNILITK